MTRLIALFSLTVALLSPSMLYAQSARWDALPGFQAGVSRCMLETPAGSLLLVGPVGLAGVYGHGLYRLPSGAQTLEDVSPTTEAVIALETAADGSLLCATEESLWRSEDDGRTWTRSHNAESGLYSVMTRLRDGNCYAVTTQGFAFVSTDHGRIWTVLPGQITDNLPVNPRYADFIGMSSHGWLLVASHQGYNHVSTDDGQTWVRNIVIGDTLHLSAEIGIIRHFTTREGALISCSREIVGRQSPDWSDFVTTFQLPRLPARVMARAIIEAPSGTLYIGVGTTNVISILPKLPAPQGGVLVSRDDGRSWAWLLQGLDVQAMLMRGDGGLVASTLTDGFVRIDTADGSHERIPFGYGHVTDLLFDGQTLFATVDSVHIQGALRSLDGGLGWSWPDSLALSQRVWHPRLFDFPELGPIVSDHAVSLFSDDWGSRWKEGRRTGFAALAAFTDSNLIGAMYLWPELPPKDARVYVMSSQWIVTASNQSSGMGGVSDLAVLPDGTVFAAATGGLFRSLDRGMTWEKQMDGSFTLLRLQPGGLLHAASDGVLRMSGDGGAHWISTPHCGAGGMHDIVARGADLYCATSDQYDGLGAPLRSPGSGIRRYTPENGWAVVMDGMTTVEVTALAADDEGYLYAGTRGCGIFRTSGPVLAAERPAAALSDFPRMTVYPQPLAGGGTLRLDLPAEGIVTVDLFDLLGRHVRSVTRQHCTAGASFLRFDGAGIPTGVYILVLRAAGQTVRQRISLM